MSVRLAEVRVTIRRVVRRTRVGIVGRTIAARAADGLAIRDGERGIDVEVGVDDGKIPGGTFTAPLGAEVGVAVLAHDDAGSDSGVGANEACKEG